MRTNRIRHTMNRSEPIEAPTVAREQEQFLDVVDRDTAERRWWARCGPACWRPRRVPLAEALGRVLAGGRRRGGRRPGVRPLERRRLRGPRRGDVRGGGGSPAALRLNAEEVATGVVPRRAVGPGTATPIATGAMLPRGADAVVMVEHAGRRRRRPAASSSARSRRGPTSRFAGTDMARGELVLRTGTRLTSRETGVLAAIGRGEVAVVRRPAGRDPLDGRRDRRAGRRRPGRRRSTTPTPPCWPTPSASWGASRSPLGIVGDDEPALDAALDRGPGAADLVAPQRRDEQGGRRPLVPRARPAVAGDRRPRRGAEAGQADLPRGGRARPRWRSCRGSRPRPSSPSTSSSPR